MTKEKIKKGLREFLSIWDKGEIIPYIVPEMIRRRKDDIPSKYWSLGNKILMKIAGTEDARGIKQWNSVGRKIKKGARAFFIFGPKIKKVIKKIITTEKVIDPETGEETEEQIEEEKEVEILSGFFPIPVFRFEDTYGDPLPEPKYEPVRKPPLFDLAKKMGIKVEWRPGDNNTKQFGYYYHKEKKIVLLTYDPHTFFHELAHAIRDRVIKEGKGKLRKPEEEEAIAEIVAGVLSIVYNKKKMVPFSVNYIKYIKGKPIKDIFSLLKEVNNVLNYVCN